MGLPLSDIKVVDFSQNMAAPNAAMYLADQGADVIKIEPPRGDSSRNSPPRYADLSTMFISLNRNKRSIVVDITKPAGREVAFSLFRWADVLVTNIRVNTRKRRGITYEEVAAVNPKIIYASLTGYGEAGPDADLPGADITIQARSGDIVGRRPVGGILPSYTRLFHFDAATSMLLAYGIMLALRDRDRNGQGQKLEANLLQTSLALHALHMTRREGSNDRYPIRPVGLPNQYMCADGRQLLSQSINIGPGWEQFLQTIGLDHFLVDPRFSSQEKREQEMAELTGILARHFATKPAAQWEAMFKAKNLSATVVKDIESSEVDEDPQVVANEMVIRFDQPSIGAVKAIGIPFRLSNHAGEQWLRRPAPRLGQHTEEILLELGYTANEIAALRDSGAISH